MLSDIDNNNLGLNPVGLLYNFEPKHEKTRPRWKNIGPLGRVIVGWIVVVVMVCLGNYVCVCSGHPDVPEEQCV